MTAAAPFRYSLEDNWSCARPFRLVLPREKRDRVTALVAHLGMRGLCTVTGCRAESMPVVLVDAEVEARLCPVHYLVHLDGSEVAGQPMLATAAW